ncbi:hypothetical protein GYMLUDRAFT_45877 [Collybiopsis luxurians FD-317 M1]|uniref:Uncharacterized protein n=1 Tax=Collybiopsis luxurians FD-317 M1 TaxID=944289 RepID=A0A0D0B378_9AGAR|nr:hypothetical protein GYMLUDRAFT_45877 [Collybiopsis luxurians FD-317 M1]
MRAVAALSCTNPSGAGNQNQGAYESSGKAEGGNKKQGSARGSTEERNDNYGVGDTVGQATAEWVTADMIIKLASFVALGQATRTLLKTYTGCVTETGQRSIWGRTSDAYVVLIYRSNHINRTMNHFL